MEKYLKLNLQQFAEAGTLVNATNGYVNAYTGSVEQFVPGVTDLSPLNKVFYHTRLLDNARDQLIFTQLGKKAELPANSGQTIEWRRWKTLGLVSRLQEGVIPTGKRMSMVAMTATLSQWGDYVTISDVAEAHAIEDEYLGASEELGASAGETQDILVRDTLLGGTNIIFGDAMNGTTKVSTPSTEADLQTALASYTVNLTAMLINKARTNLAVGAKFKTFDGKYYIAIVHPHVAEDLRHDPEWIHAHEYAQPEEIYAGEIGRVHGFRFLESNLAPIIKKSGQSYATYKTICLAKDAYGVVDPEGGGMQMIIHNKQQAGGPLEQFGTVGTKFETACKILYQERMVQLWTGSSYSSVAAANVQEAA